MEEWHNQALATAAAKEKEMNTVCKSFKSTIACYIELKAKLGALNAKLEKVRGSVVFCIEFASKEMSRSKSKQALMTRDPEISLLQRPKSCL